MSRFLPGVVVFSLLTPILLCAQDGPPARKRGTIYKEEVDGLIKVLRDTARAGQAGAPAPGVLGTDVASTAKILVAMGYCHRRYHVSDGPVVRPSLDYLLQHRRADGSFGDVAATAWTLEALAAMDADGFRAELQVGRDRLAQQLDGASPGFDAAVQGVLDQVRADRFPQDLAARDAAKASQWFAAPATLERALAADVLVALVACQVANKQLDRAQDPQAAPAAWSPLQEKGFQFLWRQQRDGMFSVPMPGKNDKGERVVTMVPSVALTGFGLMGLQTKPKAKRSQDEQAAIERGLKWLLTQQNDDGTFADREVNYTTCVVVGALTRWGDPAAAPALQKAQRAILGFQNVEGAGYERSDRDYGSVGYGGSQRGDLSNTQFALEALRATGLPENHEALKKAIVFLQRTQNLKSVNDFSGKVPDPDREGVVLDATSGDDGGAGYYPGNSAAGYIVQPDGKSIPRSYGSMTYALLKSYTLAGIKGDDPRVQAAVKWIQDNWTLAVNPGADPALGDKVKYQGLFYYYMVLAQALDMAGIETVEATETQGTAAGATAQGKAIDWRGALKQKLGELQQADGSWVNGENGRWMESLPLLCTCYAMAALERCR